MGWVLFVLLLAGGGLAYYYLTEMEKEIRAELASDESEPATSDKQNDVASTLKEPETADSLESLICSYVSESNGVLQTELYKHFPEFDRKLIQKTLLDLDRSGKISRTKSGSTYKLT